MKRPENTFCLRPLGKAKEKKKTREQRQKCCQLQLETQLHPNSKALCAVGSDAHGEVLLVQGWAPARATLR